MPERTSTGPIPLYPLGVADILGRCAGDHRLAEKARPPCRMETFGEERCWYHTKLAKGLIGSQAGDGRADGSRWT